MRKWKAWLYHRFLPAWCREDLMETSARQAAAIADLKRENERLRAYIGGMETALRRGTRVNIQAREVGK